MNSILDLAYNPHQMRGANGRWVTSGGAPSTTKLLLKVGEMSPSPSTSKVKLKNSTHKATKASIAKTVEDEFSDQEKIWSDIAADRVLKAGQENKTWRMTGEDLQNTIVSPNAPDADKKAALAEIRARRLWLAEQAKNLDLAKTDAQKTGNWRAAIRKHLPPRLAKHINRIFDKENMHEHHAALREGLYLFATEHLMGLLIASIPVTAALFHTGGA